jgi:uncharacterized protein YbjT (DUF2867 family)
MRMNQYYPAGTNTILQKTVRTFLFNIVFVVILMIHSSRALSFSSKNTNKLPVAIIGATGRLGRLAVQELVDQGIPCRLLVREIPPTADEPSSAYGVSSLAECDTKEDLISYFQSLPGVSIVAGDVSSVKALQTLVTGCGACLALFGATRRSKLTDLWNHKSVEDSDPTHAKQVNYQGVLNLIQACQASSTCKRIVRITGKGEDPTGFFSVLINLLGSMAKAWNYQGEQALRAVSNVDYTIIRPGVMSDDAPAPGPEIQLQLADDGGDLPVARIRYQDIAKLCVESLDYTNAARCTLTAMTITTKDGTSSNNTAATSSSWGELLSKVGPDRRSFPSDMLKQHYIAVRNVIWKAAGLIIAVLSAILVKMAGTL